MRQNDVIEHLRTGLPEVPTGALLVAYSGGMDSSVLLHALADIPQARERGLSAIHVHHGLHRDSGRWSSHCESVARTLQVPLRVVRARVDEKAGCGLEAAARDARMSAFAETLQRGQILVLAHHADDQAETVLLKLLRGAGPEGLGGMRDRRGFAGGLLWRPLLRLPRRTLQDYAQARQLVWIDDPSNADTKLRRNYLRLEIIPRLRRHWPQMHAAIGHSAAWARDAAEYIDVQARRVLNEIRDDANHALRWKAWLALPDALRDPVLRVWLRSMDLDEPSHVQVAELHRQLTGAATDRAPSLRWANTEIRRYREHIYAMHALVAVPFDWQTGWDGQPLRLPTGDRLRLQPQPAVHAWPGDASRVRFRRGGERFKPVGSPHTRELRILLQELAMPPWQRERMPLLYLGDELVAVGDRLLSASGQALCDRLGAHLVWERPARD